ncbi:hypothetical protein GZ77_07480 [Endozoicomonas montiporae]|uniref:Uncharacterized protein n=1 Tax=Endozoicomonas montiporae TaxID=1027273 RepID=A0A081N727_9GAMM|nr:hypothetical protein GZ77_07480 [Endozoicomonas montiporae]
MTEQADRTNKAGQSNQSNHRFGIPLMLIHARQATVNGHGQNSTYAPLAKNGEEHKRQLVFTHVWASSYQHYCDSLPAARKPLIAENQHLIPSINGMPNPQLGLLL